MNLKTTKDVERFIRKTYRRNGGCMINRFQRMFEIKDIERTEKNDEVDRLIPVGNLLVSEDTDFSEQEQHESSVDYGIGTERED